MWKRDECPSRMPPAGRRLVNSPVSWVCAALLVLPLLSSPAAAGAIDSLGPSPASPPVGYPSAPSLLADGRGGVIVVWETHVGTDRFEKKVIYAQHVLTCGKVDPAWPVDGLAIRGPEAR